MYRASSTSDSASERYRLQGASILWDRQNCIPLRRVLAEDDILLLLTPVVIPPAPQNYNTRDPFESLGKSLSQQCCGVRHVPYTKAHGITGAHIAFIRRVKAVIFVVTSFSDLDAASQPRFAEIVAEVCGDERPLIILACCHVPDDEIHTFDFSTVIRTGGFSEPHLSAVTALLVNGDQITNQLDGPSPPQSSPSTDWTLMPLAYERDAQEAYGLWTATMPPQFHLDQSSFASLLQRNGYAKHLVARQSSSGGLVGFCLTFTTFTDLSRDQLLGSLAAIIVREDFRKQGVGRSLHDEALARMSKTLGVTHVQLGSTFPRLLYGLPTFSADVSWFQDRGWELTRPGRGKGCLVADWVLRFNSMPTVNLASAGLNFRPCRITDVPQVYGMVEKESERKVQFGWYDQYARVLDSSSLSDVIVGFEGTTLAATAIIYVPGSENPLETELPWAGSLGLDIGGVTCICIKDDDPEMVNRRNTIMVRLLYACRRYLSERHMSGMFLDAIRSDEPGLATLGFHKWAEYREAWRSV